MRNRDKLVQYLYDVGVTFMKHPAIDHALTTEKVERDFLIEAENAGKSFEQDLVRARYSRKTLFVDSTHIVKRFLVLSCTADFQTFESVKFVADVVEVKLRTLSRIVNDAFWDCPFDMRLPAQEALEAEASNGNSMAPYIEAGLYEEVKENA